MHVERFGCRLEVRNRRRVQSFGGRPKRVMMQDTQQRSNYFTVKDHVGGAQRSVLPWDRRASILLLLSICLHLLGREEQCIAIAATV